MRVLPIISLWQPWASLIFEGGKVYETRSWRAPLRHVGDFIGIHATAKFPPLRLISEELHELCIDTFGCSYNYSLPQGAIIGTARLSGSLRTDECQPASEEDRIAGDWSAGRFAWPLSEITALPQPILAKGKQGWWSYDLNPELSASPLHPERAAQRRGGEHG